LYFPSADEHGNSYEARIAACEQELQVLPTGSSDEPDLAFESPSAARVKWLKSQIDELESEWRTRSYLGRLGRTIEPAVRPLGWDWRIGMAAIASFPAREVVVGTMGIIYHSGKVDADAVSNPSEETAAANVGRLRAALASATWDSQPDRKVFTVPVALSLMVFFALCCQCASTLAVIRRETSSWRWPLFTFAYMTSLAYIGALIVFQIGSCQWW
jgi:ferrous iron transport protein B